MAESALDMAMANILGPNPVREAPNGSNRSPWIDQAVRYASQDEQIDLSACLPYCAASVSYCFHLASLTYGLSLPKGVTLFEPTLSSQEIRHRAAEGGYLIGEPNDLLDSRVKGALFVWTDEDNPAHGHVGFVGQRLSDAGQLKAIQTYEFNIMSLPSGIQGGFAKKRTVPFDEGHRLYFVDTTRFVGGRWWS